MVGREVDLMSPDAAGRTLVVRLGDYIEAKILRRADGHQLLVGVSSDFVQNDGVTLRALKSGRAYGAARVGHGVFGRLEGVRGIANRAAHGGCDGSLT
jgi:hypothetical protein